MAEPFSAKLSFALKALSLSRGALAAELGVNKSMVGRWVSGAAKPSAHNLARLSEHVARRLDGDPARDDALFAEFGRRPPAAPRGSVPKALAEHLVRDIGPGQLAIGGDATTIKLNVSSSSDGKVAAVAPRPASCSKASCSATSP